MKIRRIFAFLLLISLLLAGYMYYAFSKIQPIDRQFEINTRFLTNDLHDWFAPQRTTLLISRWKENRTAGLTHADVKPSVLNECILAETPCVDMLEDIAPARPFYKSAIDVLAHKQEIRVDLQRLFKKCKLKDQSGNVIRNKEQWQEALQEELKLLQDAQHQIRWYRYFSGSYNLWHYPAMALFTFLHHSRSLATAPDWVKKSINSIITYFMPKVYSQIKQETKESVKKKTSWFFHWVVEHKVNKTFKKIEEKAQIHSYIHDYSPYYHKLQNDFDLEVKNIDHELTRLIDRNIALQEITL